MNINCSDTRMHPKLSMSLSAYLTSICYSLCFCVAIIGNSTMLLILLRNQRVKAQRVHLLLLHRNIAHLCVTLIYMPKEIIHNITVAWWGGDLLCRLCKFCDNFGNSLAANILICLSLDRFHSIFSPLYTLKAREYVKRNVTVAWIASAITSSPSVYIFRTSDHPCANWYTQCVSGDFVNVVSPKLVFGYTIVNLIQVYLLPLLVVVVCYSSILYKISESSANHSTENVKLRRSDAGLLVRARSRTLKMSLVIVVSFLLCWTPYAAASLVHFTYRPSPIPTVIRKLIYAFAVLDAVISPYLYGYFLFNLKKEFIMLWSCLATQYNFCQYAEAASGSKMKTSKRESAVVFNETSFRSRLNSKIVL